MGKDHDQSIISGYQDKNGKNRAFIVNRPGEIIGRKRPSMSNCMFRQTLKTDR
ncbi:hypothetical protein [Caldibacillus debilis]|jgi:hypothetical protein|uniref:Uncharacterized protein n=1 Tax=Caldibacillus debilis TaxID=301148 RepID=A0A150M2F5_9BACI|nr:hypothetical protein [Caldibacillus debilis]KYD18708.1 hypothetical protein B4135_2211 [Caldibacillus debilis]